MAKDILLEYNETHKDYDITFENGDLKRESGIETAVLLSLFTDRRAEEDDELPDPNKLDRRGWWGDLAEDQEDQIGSRLWLLERAKATQEVRNLAQQYIEEALEWMIEDGVAQSIEVATEIQGEVWNRRLAFEVKIRKIDGNEEVLKFDDLWEAMYAV